jgi:ribokinase
MPGWFDHGARKDVIMSDKGRVIVLGSINIDTQLSVAGFPRPGETIRARAVRTGLGGKGANQAVAAARAGAAAALHGAVGADRAPLAWLKQVAPMLDVAAVVCHDDVPTGAACVVLSADGENAIIVLGGANDRVAPPASLTLSPADICLAQMEVPAASIAGFFKQARASGARTVLNAAPALDTARDLLDLCDMVIVNETELAFFAGATVLPDDDAVLGAAQSLRRRDDQTIIVTLGAAGALSTGPQGAGMAAGRKVETVDTTGAGDCFCGVLCAGLAEGRPLGAAIARANAAAALQVGRAGAADAMPQRHEIEAAITN